MNLETLVLYNCAIKSTNVKKKENKLIPIPNLKSLNLSYNNGIVKDFKDWQAVVSSSLLELSLSNCAILNNKNFTAILLRAPNLEFLDLSGNTQLELNSHLAECLNNNQIKLRTLLLSGCSYNLDDAPILRLEQLLRLDLSNIFSGMPTTKFAQILAESYLPCIEVLLLDQNKIYTVLLT